jgi:adenylate cyclase
VKSKESMKLLEFAKSIKKPPIVLVVDEIENYKEIKRTMLTDYLFICEIFKARVNKFGFDQYLWISGHFKTLITKILDILRLDLVIKF